MALPTGARLGAFEVVSWLGAGGMGEVYRARDTRLERMVALKVLPPGLAGSAELRHRFEREARTISSLSHPHICALYDVGEHDGTAYLVMEYLEGQTLADRLGSGPLPLPQVLRYGVEIAEALSAAHRHGIVHRDLKPGNVMLTRSGAKLLDFGLAKLRPAEGVLAGMTVSALPTADKPLTGKGTLLGTVQYMAPEQLEGKEADPRTDVFALGVLLYEMATGRRPFSGGSPASLVAAILSSEPPAVSASQPMSPPALDRVVRICLEKDPDERWQSAHDVAAELKWISEGGSQAGLAAAAPGRRSRAAWTTGGLLAGVALASFVAATLLRPPPTRPRFPTRANIELPPKVALPDVDAAGGTLALSPDGEHLVFVGLPVAEGWQLYLRSRDGLQSAVIPGTAGGYCPFFSSDGRWIGFGADGKLKKVAVTGGQPVPLCDAPQLRGASWGPDDTIVFTPAVYSGLWRVPASGGAPQVVTTPDAAKKERNHRWPMILPGGKAALFAVLGRTGTENDRAIEVVDLKTGQRRPLLKEGTYPRFSGGYLIYARMGSLVAAPFDVGRLAVTGPSVPVLEDVAMDSYVNGVAQFDVSAEGSLVYVAGYPLPLRRMLAWVDRRGTPVPVTPARRPYQEQALSPDGARLAVTIDEGINTDIWACDLARETWTRLTFDGGSNAPVWSPDGKRLAFASNRGGGSNLFWLAADGSGAPEPLTHGRENAFPTSFAPDGSAIVFSEQGGPTNWDIRILPMRPIGEPRPLLGTEANETSGIVSPNGRWLAYMSTESGRPQVYVRPFPGGGEKWPISTDGGGNPVWARSGRELFYRSGDKLMAVSVRTEGPFSAGKPQPLFEWPTGKAFEWPTGKASFDVSRDGRFVMVKEVEERPAAKLVAIPYWAEEMAARLRQAHK
jgi:serine/threonine-protein kinase